MPVSREEAERAIVTLRDYTADRPPITSMDIRSAGMTIFYRDHEWRSLPKTFYTTSDALDWAEQQRGGEHGG